MIIPVLDLKDGIAVSGKSGKRETYTPLKTVFSKSSDPLNIAKSLKEAGASRIYIADLDSIEKIGDNFEIIKKINSMVSVMLDAGVSNAYDVKRALRVADKVIIATETLKNMGDLEEIFTVFDRERIIISIDIKNDEIFSKFLKIGIDMILQKLNDLRPREIILLDISRVGTEKGVNLKLINKFKELETSLIIGGGVTDKEIKTLHKERINKVLIGTALHNGKISIN